MFDAKHNEWPVSSYDAFGAVACPKCDNFWLKDFVPTHCTKCGTRLAEVPGKGMERLIETAPIKIIACRHCGERYPDVSALYYCFRCYAPIDRRSITDRLAGFVRRLLGMRDPGQERHERAIERYKRRMS
jgi:DNA-directed RNA polymerase subunit RPC12/RpoP